MKKNKNENIIVRDTPYTEEEKDKAEADVDTTAITQDINKALKEDAKSKKKGETKKQGGRVLQCFAYFSVILIAFAMILRLIFQKTDNTNIADAFQIVGECFAYIVCIWLGFFFTLKRSSRWWLVGWIVATIILVVFYIFAIV